jgi:hypothetical protein
MNHIWGPTPSDRDEKDSHPLIEYTSGMEWERRHWMSWKNNKSGARDFFALKMRELKAMNDRGEHCFACTMVCLRLYVYCLEDDW